MAIEGDAYVKFGEGSGTDGPKNTPLPLIEGDSTDATHYYWSELRDCNFGFASKDPEPEGADGDSKKPTKQLDQVTLTKKVDWASTQLFQKCCEAAKAKIAKSKEEQSKGRIDQVTVEVCKTAGGVKFPFLIIKYYGVRVVDYAVSMSGPEPSETIKLEIEKFVAREYWSLVATLATPRAETFEARLVGADGRKITRLDIGTGDEAHAFKRDLETAQFSVAAVEAKLPVMLVGPTGCGKTRLVEHLAARLRDGRRLRDRRQADGRRLGRGFAFEGILPAAVVHGTGLSLLRTGLGQWRPDRRQFPEAERQEEEDGQARGRGSRGLKLRRPVPSYSRHERRLWPHDRFHRRIAVV